MTTTTATATRPYARARRTPTSSGVVGALNCEWAHLAAAPTRTGDTRWGDLQPALAGLDTLGQIREALSREHDGPRTDEILHALLTLHAQGFPLAGRTVLQAMLGRTTRLSWTARRRQLLDHAETAVAAMWAAIDAYPLRRVHKVAANLSLEALHMLETNALDEVPANPQTIAEQVHDAQERHRYPDPTDTIYQSAVDTLLWANQTGALTRGEIELLARMHLADDAPDATLVTVAAELALPYETVRKRYQRAIRRLAHAIHTSMTEAPS